jgi:hypothetical protein
MQTLDEMLVERDVLTGKILRTISDMRADEEVKETVKKLFSYFPDCNGFVLMAAYKGERGERFVYSFDEVEESLAEGFWMDQIGEELSTINSWISENRPSKWEPEIDKLFDELSEIYPYPLEEEFDWDGMELDYKTEVLILKNGEYV